MIPAFTPSALTWSKPYRCISFSNGPEPIFMPLPIFENGLCFLSRTMFWYPILATEFSMAFLRKAFRHAAHRISNLINRGINFIESTIVIFGDGDTTVQ